jgi:hypothetical protein
MTVSQAQLKVTFNKSVSNGTREIAMMNPQPTPGEKVDLSTALCQHFYCLLIVSALHLSYILPLLL